MPSTGSTTFAQRVHAPLRRTLEKTKWGSSRLEARRKQQAIHFYSEFLEEDFLCFDIGANVGDRTELFRAIGARTIAVEPQKACVRELQKRFEGDPKVTIAPVAVGSRPGTAEIAICDNDPTISTMSKTWQTDGRFADREWSRSESVPVTTLDRLIAEHGIPSFCKIDVEGFERQVLEGLSSPLPCVSFEFTQEFQDEARSCLELLEAIGPIEANISIGESMRLLGEWIQPGQVFKAIDALPRQSNWGDVYVRSLGPLILSTSGRRTS